MHVLPSSARTGGQITYIEKIPRFDGILFGPIYFSPLARPAAAAHYELSLYFVVGTTNHTVPQAKFIKQQHNMLDA